VRAILAGSAALLALAVQAGADPCADPAACCVDPAACVITDKQSLAEITVDAMVPGGVASLRLGAYVSGGDELTGVAPRGYPAQRCGLSNELLDLAPAAAVAAVDHLWLASFATPKVFDFGAPVKTALVLVAVDHPPFPEEGIESTVWGSDSPDVSAFPAGWQLATLSAIWKQGWEEPAECEPGDNADDFVGQYTFPSEGFRYVAVHADYSITIFDDPSHASWSAEKDDSSLPGWQSDDDEIDAVGTPSCEPGALQVDAGPDASAPLGGEACLQGVAESLEGVSQLAWDLDGDGDVDTTGAEGCVPCSAIGERSATLFAIDGVGCAGADTARVTCTCPAAPGDSCLAAPSPGSGKLALGAAKGALSWSWKKGPDTAIEAFGDPTQDTAYRLCLYDGTAGEASLAFESAVAPGAGWKTSRRGFRYRRPAGAEAGLRTIQLKAGSGGKAALALAGRVLALPALPLEQVDPAVIQLFQSEGTCFESRFTTPARRNDAKAFKDRSD
jgi:hypothetical protein